MRVNKLDDTRLQGISGGGSPIDYIEVNGTFIVPGQGKLDPGQTVKDENEIITHPGQATDDFMPNSHVLIDGITHK